MKKKRKTWANAKFSRVSMTGQIFVLCPYCNGEFKEDGVGKHVRAVHK